MPVGDVHARRKQQIGQPQRHADQHLLDVAVEQVLELDRDVRRQAGRPGDQSGGHHLHGQVGQPDRDQQAGEQRHPAQRGDEGDDVEAGQHDDVERHHGVQDVQPGGDRSGQRRHGGKIFGGAHRHVEQHADEQRHHDAAGPVKAGGDGRGRL